MLKLNVLNLLKLSGHSKYWLNQHLDMSSQNLNDMLDNTTESIRYQTIDDLCTIFECSPNDLFSTAEGKEEEEILKRRAERTQRNKARRKK